MLDTWADGWTVGLDLARGRGKPKEPTLEAKQEQAQNLHNLQQQLLTFNRVTATPSTARNRLGPRDVQRKRTDRPSAGYRGVPTTPSPSPALNLSPQPRFRSLSPSIVPLASNNTLPPLQISNRHSPERSADSEYDSSSPSFGVLHNPGGLRCSSPTFTDISWELTGVVAGLRSLSPTIGPVAAACPASPIALDGRDGSSPLFIVTKSIPVNPERSVSRMGSSSPNNRRKATIRLPTFRTDVEPWKPLTVKWRIHDGGATEILLGIYEHDEEDLQCYKACVDSKGRSAATSVILCPGEPGRYVVRLVRGEREVLASKPLVVRPLPVEERAVLELNRISVSCSSRRAAVDMTALPTGVDARGAQSSKQLQAAFQIENANRTIGVREVVEDTTRPSQSFPSQSGGKTADRIWQQLIADAEVYAKVPILERTPSYEQPKLSVKVLRRAVGSNGSNVKIWQGWDLQAGNATITHTQWTNHWSLSDKEAMQVVERELHTDLTVGARIADRFDLVRRVGNGSFGTVFQCTDLQQGSQCALKFEWGTLVNQLNGEAELLRSSQDIAGVPLVLWVGQSHGCRVMAMELFGPCLADADLSPAELCEISQGVVLTLQAIHTVGIVHLDIKPGNICLDLNNRKVAKLIDFGLSVTTDYTFDEADHRSKRAGTPEYMSPDRHKQQSPCPLDDMFGLLYTILALKLPGGVPWKKQARSDEIKNVHRAVLEEKKSWHRTWRLDHSLCGEGLSEVVTYLMDQSRDDPIDYGLIHELVHRNDAIRSYSVAILDEISI